LNRLAEFLARPLSTGTLAEVDTTLSRVRSGVTLLVVAHHAALAYTSFSQFDMAHYAWSSAPVVDEARWPMLDYLVAWNDIYFMALLFLVSGLYVPGSLSRKGVARFLFDRAWRLGGAFVLGVVLLVPLAYWPSWRLGDQGTTGSFLLGFFAGDGWPVGPPWFLWVLLAFNVVVAMTSCLCHTGTRESKPRWPASGAAIVSWLFAASILSVAPTRLVVAPDTWFTLGGPFDAQTSRLPLYAAYFALGLALGVARQRMVLVGVARGMLTIWLCVAFASFVAHWHVSGTAPPNAVGRMFVGLVFAVCCASSSLAGIGLVSGLGNRSRLGVAALDRIGPHAFAIYLLHYPFVTWLQFGLLATGLTPALKFCLVLTGALGGSWVFSRMASATPLRRLL
jgi:glucans biosynthesis protein C